MGKVIVSFFLYPLLPHDISWQTCCVYHLLDFQTNAIHSHLGGNPSSNFYASCWQSVTSLLTHFTNHTQPLHQHLLWFSVRHLSLNNFREPLPHPSKTPINHHVCICYCPSVIYETSRPSFKIYGVNSAPFYCVLRYRKLGSDAITYRKNWATNTGQVLRCCNATMVRASKASHAVISVIQPRWFGGEAAWRKEGADGCKEYVLFKLSSVTSTFFSQQSYRDLLIAVFQSRELNSLFNYPWLSFTPPIKLSISNTWWPYHLRPVDNTHISTMRAQNTVIFL